MTGNIATGSIYVLKMTAVSFHCFRIPIQMSLEIKKSQLFYRKYTKKPYNKSRELDENIRDEKFGFN